jgi:hypothetical protein
MIAAPTTWRRAAAIGTVVPLRQRQAPTLPRHPAGWPYGAIGDAVVRARGSFDIDTRIARVWDRDGITRPDRAARHDVALRQLRFTLGEGRDVRS